MDEHFTIYDAEAHQITEILVAEVGLRDDRAPGSARISGGASDLYDWLISGATSREIRLNTQLGYGGKLLIQATQAAPVVTCYAEDETDAINAMIRRANSQLRELFADIDLMERAR